MKLKEIVDHENSRKNIRPFVPEDFMEAGLGGIIQTKGRIEAAHDTAGTGTGDISTQRGLDNRDNSQRSAQGSQHNLSADTEASQIPDYVNHPPHYTAHPSGVECITITEWMNFNLGNAMKYIWRADSKGATIEDLEKARWYVEREIDRLRRLSK